MRSKPVFTEYIYLWLAVNWCKQILNMRTKPFRFLKESFRTAFPKALQRDNFNLCVNYVIILNCFKAVWVSSVDFQYFFHTGSQWGPASFWLPTFFQNIIAINSYRFGTTWGKRRENFLFFWWTIPLSLNICRNYWHQRSLACFQWFYDIGLVSWSNDLLRRSNSNILFAYGKDIAFMTYYDERQGELGWISWSSVDSGLSLGLFLTYSLLYDFRRYII